MRVGAVVIGRNEGAKLRRCLASVVGRAAPVVYVDSGSVDDSVALAQALGVEVVRLDPASPFTVARARNEGFDRLKQLDPAIELVQFLDGDSEMVDSWLPHALAAFAAQPRCAVICGSIPERFPNRSPYTRVYSMSHDTRVVDANASSGIAIMRADALRQVGGFVPWLVGREDREISQRLRSAGWYVRRLKAPMAVHEAEMDRFGQWWRRRINTGRSLAQEIALRFPPERQTAREWLSAWFWGLALPAVALAAAWPTHGASLLLFAGHLGLAVRIHRRMRRLGFDRADAALYATECTAAKFPQALGMLRFYLGQLATSCRRSAHAVKSLPQRRDLFLLAYLPVMTGIAWLLPEAWWPRICAAAVRLSAPANRKRRAEGRHIARLLAGHAMAADADHIAASLSANHHHLRLHLLRCYRAGSRRPRVTMVGSEHVAEALSAGRGCILWIAPFAFSDVITKMAFHQSAYAVTHLSRPEHGFSPSPFGKRFLNPIYTTIERRFLAERLVIEPGQSVRALRELRRRVKRNQLVSIAVGPQGRQHCAPFLAGSMRIAEGAPYLACSTGAALLPVFTVRREDGSFVTTVEAPLRIPAGLDQKQAVGALVAQCGERLESYALRWPEQYSGWTYASVAESPAGAEY